MNTSTRPVVIIGIISAVLVVGLIVYFIFRDSLNKKTQSEPIVSNANVDVPP